jgi:hypothetical protein
LKCSSRHKIPLVWKLFGKLEENISLAEKREKGGRKSG